MGGARDTQDPCLSDSSVWRVLSCWTQVSEAWWLSALGGEQCWGLITDSRHSAKWWCKPTAVVRSWPDLSGRSLKHVSKTHGITKRSRPEATPVALEPWHYKGKPVSKPHKTWIACLTFPTALPCMHINFCSVSCFLSFPFLCRTVEQVQAGRCQQVQPHTQWTGRTRGEDGGPQLREVCA